MTRKDIIQQRLVNQRIIRTRFSKPEEAVAWHGAVQAQDYPGALWAVALRTKGATLQKVERAIAERKIIRTWPMRGTLHFVAGPDIRWMLELLTPRVNAGGGWATRRKFLGLEESDIRKASRLVRRALQGGNVLTRQELYDVLERGGVSPARQRGLHILSKMAHELLICFGPHQGKQPTFVLLDEWVPRAKPRDRSEALAELAKRYFTSHGPATLQDFAWWSGLTVSEARLGLQAVASRLESQTLGRITYWMPRHPTTHVPLPGVHLLPPYDEYLVAYRDRSTAVNLAHAPRGFPPYGAILRPVIIVDGMVVGTWRRATKGNAVVITATPFNRLARAEIHGLSRAVDRYGQFAGMAAEMRISRS